MSGVITLKELTMDRDVEYPLSPELSTNLTILHDAVNVVRAAYGRPMIVTSGYRPGKYNVRAGGAAGSAHLTCEAADFADRDGELKKWCLGNMTTLREAGLYMEDPAATPTWCHLQTRRPPSGNLIFGK